jgi:hypothetical protein
MNSDKSVESAENTRLWRPPVADTAALPGAARSTALVIWLRRLGVILCADPHILQWHQHRKLWEAMADCTANIQVTVGCM